MWNERMHKIIMSFGVGMLKIPCRIQGILGTPLCLGLLQRKVLFLFWLSISYHISLDLSVVLFTLILSGFCHGLHNPCHIWWCYHVMPPLPLSLPGFDPSSSCMHLAKLCTHWDSEEMKSASNVVLKVVSILEYFLRWYVKNHFSLVKCWC